MGGGGGGGGDDESMKLEARARGDAQGELERYI
jgi:hypothetical protein